MKRALAILWGTSGRRALQLHAGTVAVAGGSYAVVLALFLWSKWDFAPAGASGVRGRAWLSQYPPGKELAAVAAVTAALVVGIVVSRLVWCGIAAGYRAGRSGSREASLRATAIASLPLLTCWIPLAAGQWQAVGLVWLPGTLALLASLMIVLQGRRGGAERARWVLLAVVVPTLLYFFVLDRSHMVGPINLFEEGASLAPLQTALSGGAVFRDTYLQHGLFQNYGKPLIAASIQVSLVSLRLVNALLLPLGYLAIYVLGLCVFRSAATAVALPLILTAPGLHISDRQTFGFLGIALVAAAIRRKQRDGRPGSSAMRREWPYYLGSGGCAVLGFFYSVEIGLYTLAACGAFLVLQALTDWRIPWVQRRNRVLCFCGGVVLTALPFLCYFAWLGVLSDFAANVYTQCVYQSEVWGLPYPSLLEELRAWSGVRPFLASQTIRFYIPIATYLVVAGWIAFRACGRGFWRRPGNPILLLLALAAFAWFRTTLGRTDRFHLAEGTPFLWVFVLMAVESVLRRLRAVAAAPKLSGRSALATAAMVVAGAVAGYAMETAYGPISSVSQRWLRVAAGGNRLPALQPATDRFGGMAGEESFGMFVGSRLYTRILVERIAQLTQPGQYIFDMTNQAALYFLADRRSPSRYQQLVYAAAPQHREQLVADLRATRPPLVVWKASRGWDEYLNFDGVSSKDRHPEVYAYVRQHYRYASSKTGTTFWIRRDLLPDALANLRGIALVVDDVDRRAIVTRARQLTIAPDPQVRIEAVAALGKFTNTLALKHLLRGLRDADAGVRRATLRALGAFADALDPAVVSDVLRSDSDPAVRLEGVRLLGDFKGRATRAVLVRSTTDADPEVRALAIQLVAATDTKRSAVPFRHRQPK